MGKLDQLIDEGAYLERQVLTTNVDCIQLGVPERILRKNGAQRVFEHGVFKHRARQRRETDTGTDGVRNRHTHRSEAKHDSRRDFKVAVWAREVP